MNEVKTAAPEASIGGVQVSLQSVYLKDCSYESPNGPRLPNNQAWEPKFQLNMNTSAEDLAPDVREVLLTITLLSLIHIYGGRHRRFGRGISTHSRLQRQ